MFTKSFLQAIAVLKPGPAGEHGQGGVPQQAAEARKWGIGLETAPAWGTLRLATSHVDSWWGASFFSLVCLFFHILFLFFNAFYLHNTQPSIGKPTKTLPHQLFSQVISTLFVE